MPSESSQALRGASISSLVTSMAINFAVFGAEILAFILLRKVFKVLYEPKTGFVKTVPLELRSDVPTRNPLLWILPLFQTPPHAIIGKSGLDAYFLLRYLRNFIVLFAGGMLLTWPILLPLNTVDSNHRDVKGLDKLTFGGVSTNHRSRYWAHLIVAWVFIIATLYMIHRELDVYVKIRQAYVTSPAYSNRQRASTILLNTVPKPLLNEDKLTEMFSIYPGGVKRVWLNRDYQGLQDKIDLRARIVNQLENAEVQYIKQVLKGYRQKMKHEQKAQSGKASLNGNTRDSLTDKGSLSTFITATVSRKKRPTHRLPMFGAQWMIALPLVGRKVDSIHWCKKELSRLNKEIDEDKENPEKFTLMNSAFVQFHNQFAAHMACQSVAHERPQYLTPRLADMSPKEVIWSNMRLQWWERIIRQVVIYAAITAMTIFWAIPTAFISAIGHVNEFTGELKVFNFIFNLPKWALGLITGILPTVLLALLLILVPVIMRIGSILMGSPSNTETVRTVQAMYFAFLFVQIFLVVTIGGGISATIQDLISDPSSSASILANQLPKSSTFFFSYLLLQGLSIAAAGLLQLWNLVVYLLFGKPFDSTPRQKWKRSHKLSRINWGTTFPKFTVYAVIGLSYSIIAPLIMVFVIIAFGLFYLTYMYKFLYVYAYPVDMVGLTYPRAILQTLTGIYVLEIALAGLFFLQDDTKAQGALMVTLLVLTVGFNILLKLNYSPLTRYLPIALYKKTDGDLSGNEKAERWDKMAKFLAGIEARRASWEQQLTEEEKKTIEEVAYTHEALRSITPTVWLPKDHLGVAELEVSQKPDNVLMSLEDSVIDSGGIKVIGNPPDYDWKSSIEF